MVKVASAQRHPPKKTQKKYGGVMPCPGWSASPEEQAVISLSSQRAGSIAVVLFVVRMHKMPMVVEDKNRSYKQGAYSTRGTKPPWQSRSTAGIETKRSRGRYYYCTCRRSERAEFHASSAVAYERDVSKLDGPGACWFTKPFREAARHLLVCIWYPKR